MRNLSLLAVLVASGCWGGDGYYDRVGGGGDDYRSFEVDSGCSLSSTLTLSGSPTTWTGCRLRYDDATQVYTWQFTTPSSTGTWVGQGPGWFSLAFNLDSPENTRLGLSAIAGVEPGYVPPDQVVFSYAPEVDGNVGGTGFIDVGSNIVYPGGSQSALDAHVSIDIPGFGSLTGEASASIGGNPDAGVPTDLATSNVTDLAVNVVDLAVNAVDLATPTPIDFSFVD